MFFLKMHLSPSNRNNGALRHLLPFKELFSDFTPAALPRKEKDERLENKISKGTLAQMKMEEQETDVRTYISTSPQGLFISTLHYTHILKMIGNSVDTHGGMIPGNPTGKGSQCGN